MTRFAGALAAGALALLACAHPPAATLRVGSSGDYAPFSFAAPGSEAPPEGFDVDIARAYAADRGLKLELVRFRWPELLDDLRTGRFDVAMSGVTVRPERSASGLFTVPVLRGGAVALVLDPQRFPDVAALDAPGVRISVNAGGHLESVARAGFTRARLEPRDENVSVPAALAAGDADAAISDVFEAPHWRRALPGAVVLGPFTADRKAYLVRAERPALAADLDAWLLAREADGSLARLRRRHLGHDAAPPTAEPLDALLAAMDERLELMGPVAAAKARAGIPVHAPAREVRVLDAAVAATREAAARAGRAAPPEPAVRALFAAQIAAAREIQAHALREPPEGPNFDLEHELRPALLRIGERIARLLVELPDALPREEVRRRAAREIDVPGLSADSVRALADAVAALAP